MLIDTIMALWNRILDGKLKKVVITSFLLGIGLAFLLIMIGIPTFSHSSPINKRTIQSIDLANKKEHAISTQIYLDGLSTPPSTSAASATFTPTVPQPLPTISSDEPRRTDQVSVSPPSLFVPIVIVPKHVPVAIFCHATATHQTVRGIKNVKPSPTRVPTSTSVPPTATAVPTPKSEALPTPTPSTSARDNNFTPVIFPPPTLTGTVTYYPRRMPEITPTSTETVSPMP